MTSASDQTRRKRPSLDSRHWAAGLAGAITFATGTIHEGKQLLEVVTTVLIAFMVLFLIGWFALPPWRDPRHGPWAGAMVILLAGAAAAVAILLIPESVWPS